jgi:hypothetical protein
MTDLTPETDVRGPGRAAATNAAEPPAGAGWQFFGGILLLLLGIMGMIDGVVAITEPDLFKDNLGTAPQLPATDNLAAWGWVVLVLGVVMAALAFPVIAGLRNARLVGLVAAGLNILLQFAYLPHFPLWSLTVIFLSVIVIYALAVHGQAWTPFRSDSQEGGDQ